MFPTVVLILNSPPLSSFKMSKKRRIALSARSGLTDNRPTKQDTNIWSGLVRRHRGYVYAARVLSKDLGLFRAAGSINTASIQCKGPYQKGLWALFAAERENSYNTMQNRKGTPSFPIVEERNILFLCGRKMAEEPKIKNHPSTNKTTTIC